MCAGGCSRHCSPPTTPRQLSDVFNAESCLHVYQLKIPVRPLLRSTTTSIRQRSQNGLRSSSLTALIT
ncbi:unnamed protein product [Cylicocyclus nassatus]|uniref:Uncharacterized protein n=1 Tax=Cylicocyclus nassatus TaxID=53992 RepID=A0AA36M548_CYLNA|nr:unnamed protein product [Cylicocyclus nassatus]